MELNSELDRYIKMYEKFKGVDKALSLAKVKHPNYPRDMYEQVAIITEELGEVSKAVLEYHNEKEKNIKFEDIKNELEQTAAMCIRMLEFLEFETSIKNSFTKINDGSINKNNNSL